MMSSAQNIENQQKCPLCDSTAVSYFDRHNRIEQYLYHCRTCFFYFTWPHVPIIHGVDDGIEAKDDDAGRDYWANSEAMKDYISWREEENERLAKWVIATGKLGKLLEIGVGDGPLMKRLAPACSEYWGIEPDPEAFSRLRERFPEHAKNIYPILSSQLDTGAPFSTADGTFDSICMMSVLEHISDPCGFFKSASRLLKTGGKLLISVPNSRCFWLFYRLRKIVGIEPWAYFHISFFRQKNLRSALEDAGFIVREMRTHTLLTPDSISYFRKRFKSRLLGLGMTGYKALGMDKATGMNTLFVVAEKRGE